MKDLHHKPPVSAVALWGFELGLLEGIGRAIKILEEVAPAADDLIQYLRDDLAQQREWIENSQREKPDT